jgi:hypothetical protein
VRRDRAESGAPNNGQAMIPPTCTWVVTPKGALRLAMCNASATRKGL